MMGEKEKEKEMVALSKKKQKTSSFSDSGEGMILRRCNDVSEVMRRCVKRKEEIEEKEAELECLEKELDCVNRKIVAAERNIYGQKKEIAEDYRQALVNCQVLLVDSDELFQFAIKHFGHDHTKKFKVHPGTTAEELLAIYQTGLEFDLNIPITCPEITGMAGINMQGNRLTSNCGENDYEEVNMASWQAAKKQRRLSECSGSIVLGFLFAEVWNRTT